MIKRWIPYKKDYYILEELIEELNISEVLARILINRNIETVEDAEIFLNPSIDELDDPYMMKEMDVAVERIKKAIIGSEKICIYGDYDVDGITSVSMLYIVLKELGGKVTYYIPNRLDEGYGLNGEALEKIIEQNIQLIITVDCGIKSLEEVKFINENNRDIIITDHHECGDLIPDAYAVINPNQKDCDYSFKPLAGAGVAFKLACALAQNFQRSDLPEKIIDLAAFGTVADVVPLIGENRIIVKSGLDKIKAFPNVGLEALVKVCGIEISNINTYHLSYLLAPRLNAAGRLSDPIIGVELLTSNDSEFAYKIAEELNNSNSLRQSIEREILAAAVEAIERDLDIKEEKVIVLAGENWHIGVIGIVASRLMEKYAMPVVLISLEDHIGRGSARSLPGFNIYEAMNKCNFLFEKFGGHDMAAGLTIKEENINSFRKLINEIAEEILRNKKIIPEILVDYKIDKVDLLPQLVEEMDILQPFGEGNSMPVFVFRGLIVKDIKLLGNNKHLSMYLSDGKSSVRGIGFNIGFMINSIEVNQKIDIICSVEKNVWNGNENIQLNIKDIKKTK
ncbi:MAG: single-stranded-DNA-specific exonuclease RecJ [Lutispora sp.]|nr:single-stranded-DNA-specific exonuclease RecJ [Lutispora sp.]MDD4834464.1 single-stranded-DNA-specific exonuclease RecJ [Lutispora sp.]